MRHERERERERELIERVNSLQPPPPLLPQSTYTLTVKLHHHSSYLTFILNFTSPNKLYKRVCLCVYPVPQGVKTLLA